MGDVLGEGTSAEVCSVFINGSMVAVKIFKREYAENARFELEHLGKLVHPHLNGLMPPCTQAAAQKLFPGRTVIALELCVPVKHHMRASMCMAKWCVQLAEAVRYLHAQSVMHCDVKPENVYVNLESIQLGDLGLASKSPILSQYCQSPPYAPPEASTRGQLVTFPADVWSLMVTLLEMVSNEYVFPYQERGEALKKIVSEPIRDKDAFFSRIKAPGCLKDLASIVLRPAEERPCIDEVAAFLTAKLGATGLDTNIFV